jgi:uncharacterized membrane protein YagU involved in acid resistance
MARSTDLNSGFGVYLEHIGSFCVDVAYLLTQKHNRLKLVDCAKQGISVHILIRNIAIAAMDRLKLHPIAHQLLENS